MLLLQLAHDLKEVPTVEIVELNTDAVMYMIEEEYVEEAHKVLQDWQDLTGLELEQDKIKKLVMRDVNNYVEIVQTKKGYEVHYKGGEFRGNHKFEWNNDKNCFEYTFKDDLENNSLTIVSEAIIKNLLFNTPVEETINNCNDIFRFQMISHLGHTYQKCVLKNKDGSEIELQRNNRIYAGLEKTGGKIYKVKEDGRYDSLANCPPNPIVDNKNVTTIDMINKKWYINYTLQKINDFKGKKEVFMDEKLDKLKKDELIEMVKDLKERVDGGTTLTSSTDYMQIYCNGDKPRLLQKINKFREEIRKRNFILDKELPKNLGNGEIYSIDQIYQAVQDTALKVGLDFSFEVTELDRLDLGAFKPMTGAPQNIATIKCRVTFTDIDTGEEKTYTMMSQGSDSIDKSVNGASSYAFRNWFNKNFTPCIINGEKISFGEGNDFTVDAMEIEEPKSQPKVPTFVPAEKKEEIVKQITSEQNEEVKEEKTSDIDTLTNLIYEYRELTGNEEAGAKKLEAIINKQYTDMDLLKWTLDFKNAINDLKKGN